MTTGTAQETGLTSHPEVGIQGPFDRINAPGSFVVNRSGELLRIPEDALAPGRSPTIDIVSRDPWLVTRISTDPYVSLNKARALAADMDLPVNF